MSALDPAISTIIAASIALLLVAAALHKLSDWPRFRAALAGYRIVPAWLAPMVAPGLAALEVTAAVLLVLSSTRRAGAFLAAALLTAYAVAIGINLLRGRTSIDCGCLGAGGRSRIGRWMVLRNLALAAATLTAALPMTERSLTALDVVTIAGAGASLAALYSAQDLLHRTAHFLTGSARP